MFYYKTINSYESRNMKSTDPDMQEITQQEYAEAVTAMEAAFTAESTEQQRVREAKAADLAEALALLGYKEGEN